MTPKTENHSIITDRMCRNEQLSIFGLIGHPLGHSFSAAYFNEKFSQEGLQGFSYRNFDLPDLETGIAALKADTACRGFNVTVPYKQEILRFLDKLSPQAQSIGAVNTVKVENNGTWTGYNTDYIGFYDSLKAFLPQGKPKALIMGNGGASQAVQYALRIHNWEYIVVCRNPKAGMENMISYAELTPQIVSYCGLLVNTTRLGMFPDTDSCPDIPYEAVGGNHCAFDLVYNPETTAFMKRCAAQGARTLNGLDMLHRQAEVAWKIWQ